MSDTSPLLIEENDGVAIVTLNRPQVMNALSRELRRLLAEAFDRFAADPDIRVVILTGAGERAFCAGLDLKELGQNTGGSPQEQLGDLEPMGAMARFRGPIIAAINGVAVTGGFELALACDVLIGSHNARFADTHARIGIMPAWGLSQRLSRIVGPSRAKEISLTGNFISAETACNWGILNRMVAAQDLMDNARSLARDMLGCIPQAQADLKHLIDTGYELPFGEAMKLEASTSSEQIGNVRSDAIAQRRESVRARGRRQV